MEDTLAINNNNNGAVSAAPPPASMVSATAPVGDMTPPVALPAQSPPPPESIMPASPYAPQKFDIMRDVNWTETLLFGLFGTAFACVIVYYRFKLKEDKIINSDIQRQLDNQNMRVGKIETGLSHARIPY